ncbi:MAG: molybdate ABC transporter substrate-binding protein [Chloroflexi bacterium RBG_16_68_14]|nr:MAG: molybdate ABC transporter substrate-binding protein [Chloroflexi bacterium RBG_16_68_14]
MRLAVLGLNAVLLAAVAAGWGGGGDLTVFAAASLRGPLEEIALAFEEKHPDVDLSFNFAGSQRLRFQLEQGAEASVFVSADERQMQLAQDAELLVGEPVVFARNRLVVAVAGGNPGDIQTLEGLAASGLRLVWADQGVPLGAYTRQALAAMSETFGADFAQRVEANVVSQEENAEAVAGKVELGEADAAIVYETDSPRLRREGATVIPIPDAYQPDIRYLVALLSGTGNLERARAFIDFLLSERGQRIFVKYGFLGVQ